MLLRGWQVAGLARVGVANTHGQNGHLLDIVKHVGTDAHPGSQALTTGVIKRYSPGMHLAPGCLPGNHNASLAIDLRYGPQAICKVCCTLGRGAHLRAESHQVATVLVAA